MTFKKAENKDKKTTDSVGFFIFQVIFTVAVLVINSTAFDCDSRVSTYQLKASFVLEQPML